MSFNLGFESALLPTALTNPKSSKFDLFLNLSVYLSVIRKCGAFDGVYRDRELLCGLLYLEYFYVQWASIPGVLVMKKKDYFFLLKTNTNKKTSKA